jgi:hypothetical protein
VLKFPCGLWGVTRIKRRLAHASSSPGSGNRRGTAKPLISSYPLSREDLPNSSFRPFESGLVEHIQVLREPKGAEHFLRTKISSAKHLLGFAAKHRGYSCVWISSQMILSR